MSKTVSLLFPWLLLVLYIFINHYLAVRHAALFQLNYSKIIFWSLSLGVVGLFFLMFRHVNGITTMSNIIFIGSTVLIGYYLYIIVATGAVHLVELFYQTKPIYYGLMSLGLAAVISIYGILNARHTIIIERDVELSQLMNPIKAAHLTDTHIGHIRGKKNLSKIVKMINDQNVDVVFFTGDLLDGKIELNLETVAPLKNLNAPVFFVEGNHDVHTGVSTIKSYLKQLGIRVLENEIEIWNDIQVIGLDHMVADKNSFNPHTDPNGPTIENTLNKMDIDTSKPSILLHHGPDGIQYADKAGVSLYLAGHTHGGQLWPATHFASMMFDYNKGLHQYNQTQIYVSQGTGTFGPPMRVGTQSELTILNLIPSED